MAVGVAVGVLTVGAGAGAGAEGVGAVYICAKPEQQRAAERHATKQTLKKEILTICESFLAERWNQESSVGH